MPAQEYTVQLARNRNKMDKFNNMTFDVKFREDERTVYAAFKTTPEEGSTKYGEIIDGEYGPRFKGAQKPEYQEQRQVSTPTPIQESMPEMPKQQYADTKQDDIRWMVCVKEASNYVAKNRPDLSSDEWATEVNEYANELFKVSAGPDKEEKTTAEKMLGGTEIPF